MGMTRAKAIFIHFKQGSSRTTCLRESGFFFDLINDFL